MCLGPQRGRCTAHGAPALQPLAAVRRRAVPLLLLLAKLVKLKALPFTYYDTRTFSLLAPFETVHRSGSLPVQRVQNKHVCALIYDTDQSWCQAHAATTTSPRLVSLRYFHDSRVLFLPSGHSILVALAAILSLTAGTVLLRPRLLSRLLSRLHQRLLLRRHPRL